MANPVTPMGSKEWPLLPPAPTQKSDHCCPQPRLWLPPIGLAWLEHDSGCAGEPRRTQREELFLSPYFMCVLIAYLFMAVLTRAILCLGKQVSRPSVTCSHCQCHHHERQQSSYSGAICPKPMAQLVTSTVYLTVLRYFVLCWGLVPLIHIRFQQCSLLTKLSPALWWLSHYFMKVVHILRSFLNSTGASHMAGSRHSHSLS